MRSKVALRRQQTQQALQTIAARRFASKGAFAVSVEDIIAEAEISRRTFYTFFANKYELIAAIVIPVFEDGVEQLELLTHSPTNSLIQDIIDIYLKLWDQYTDAFYLSSQLDGKTFTLVEKQHNQFVFSLLELLKLAEGSGQLNNDSADYSLKLIARCAVPILKIYSEDARFHQLYREAMTALLAKT